MDQQVDPLNNMVDIQDDEGSEDDNDYSQEIIDTTDEEIQADL
jgi:hypothetical protein